MGMVDPTIPLLDHDNYLLPDGYRRGVGWRAATVAMGQCLSNTPLRICNLVCSLVVNVSPFID